MVVEADKGKNGRVSFEEFLAFAEAHKEDLPTMRNAFFAPVVLST
jgi:hypothetical protein